MIESLKQLDTESFLFFNGLHAPWLDPIMLYATQTYVWVPLYLFLLYFILKDYRGDSWAPVLGILITILLADQITSGLMKPFFERLRPSREPGLEGLVHTVNGYRGGLFGFASSHAANTFGLATFFWLLFRQTKKWIIVLFIWATFISYSRIYLGVHYPGDLIAGAIIGIISAFFGFRIFSWLKKMAEKKTSAL
jgi:undecaprenyl-diphosphatase